MENKNNNKNSNKWLYVNKFGYCRENIDKKVMDNYIDTILRIKPDAFDKYLAGLKEQYNTNNYLCVLENLINYIIIVFNITYRDYCHNGRDEYISKALDNISNRYATLTYIYNEEYKENK